TGEGPSFLLGAELTSVTRQGSLFTGLQETRIGLHLSDVVTVDRDDATVTVGAEGAWQRQQGPLTFRLEGQAFYRQRGEEWARTTSVAAGGELGRVLGSFRFDYIENNLAAFPWYQKDLE